MDMSDLRKFVKENEALPGDQLIGVNFQGSPPTTIAKSIDREDYRDRHGKVLDCNVTIYAE